MIKTESLLMKFFRKLGFDSIAWSLRRLHCPVKKDDLVLEVGSGGNPYFRANVLCDAYFETQERLFVPLVYDRPTILAFVENLPFKDNSFDFVIASHVLEHSEKPEKFLNELQRVAKAGYIETPDAAMERLVYFTFHRLEITERKGELLIRKKKNYIQDQELVELFNYRVSKVFPELVSKHPFNFHIRYYWHKDQGGIKFKIVNPEYKFDWDVPTFGKEAFKYKFNLSTFLKTKTLLLARKLLSQNKRNRNLNLKELLKCNKCKGEDFDFDKEGVVCKNCGEKYSVYGFKR